ncbi:MAG: OOP family OmpA-OmpF porin [Rhodothermales bacterium]|jgi:OOP family OmpA-OmpF porin
MQSAIPLLLGVLLVALLTLVCSCQVERDVLETAQTALGAGGHSDWASATAVGRWVTVSGVAPDPTSASAAGASIQTGAVLGTEAVTEVMDATTLRGATNGDVDPVRSGLARSDLSWVDLERDDSTLRMSGIASVEAEKERASEIAVPPWPWGPVDNSIDVADSEGGQSVIARRESLNALLAEDNVNFEFASAALSRASRRLLNQMAATLSGCPTTRVRVEAHSDNVGDSTANVTLSQARAEFVMRYLTSAGVDARRLSAQGYGESRPIASNETDDGRAENRRVEFRISL